ncbi:cytochrome P450 [Panaeolus papilionaceus]|nr:cytochrome P450 [Panaeolus papilionaceus]
MTTSLTTVLSFSVLSVGLWKILRWFFFKSDLDNIPGPASPSFFKGVFPQIFNVNGWDYHRYLWDTFGKVIKIKGVMGENQLYIYDPKAMHHILVKDAAFYESHTSFVAGMRLIFGPGLLGIVGDYHKKQRKLLNPVFSIAHMRQMAPTFYKITHKLQDALAGKVKDGPQEIDLLSWMSRTALELIAQSGFGHSFDDLKEDQQESEFSFALKLLAPTSFKLIFFRVYLLNTSMKIGSPAFRRMLVNLIPSKSFHLMRDLVDILHETSYAIYQSKKKALVEGDGEVLDRMNEGKDILSILMRANMQASEEDRLSEEEIYAQISTFTFAGMDTTSSGLSRALWILAQRKEAQTKLRSEIREAMAQAGGDLDYDTLVGLPYLDAVCRETLRVYTPISTMMRHTLQDTILPLSTPITGVDGTPMDTIHIPKGTSLILGLLASNRNTELWGVDAHEWNPDRWLSPLPEELLKAHLPGIYANLMTFSAGGRSCIGFKFSQLEMSTSPPLPPAFLPPKSHQIMLTRCLCT